MLPSLAELKDELDGLLSRCHDEIGATKAALYLAADDPNADAFEPVSQYGHDQRLPERLASSDLLVAQLLKKRSAFRLNGNPSELEYLEMIGLGADRLFRERLPLLLVPIYPRGRVVGFLELQQKVGGFTPADLDHAKRLAASFIDCFAERGLYGLSPRGSEKPIAENETNVVPLRVQRSKDRRRREFSATAREAIVQAKAAVARESASAHPSFDAITDEQLSAAKSVLPTILSLPGSVLASFISQSTIGPTHLMAARSSVTEHALELFQTKISSWMRKRREDPRIPRPSILQPFGGGGPTIQPAHISTVLSAEVTARNVPGIVLAVAFENTPEQKTHRQLEIFLHEIERALEQSALIRDLHLTRRKIAEKLIEPDFESYTELREHCSEVSALCERFAREVGLSATDSENLTLAGLVHDAGLRPLDYRDLANESDLPEEDLQAIREHPIVGAAMVAPLLGWTIGNIVLAHQERFDGSGYPYGIRGDRIPIIARMLQLCDAWVAMTLARPYRKPLSHDEALGEIERGSGSQFDPDLAARFRTMMTRSERKE